MYRRLSVYTLYGIRNKEAGIKNIVRYLMLVAFRLTRVKTWNKKLNDCMRKENIRNFSEFARQKLIRTDLNIQKVSFEGLVPLTEELEQVGKNINSIARLATVVGKISYENKMDMSILMQKIVDVMEEKDVYLQK